MNIKFTVIWIDDTPDWVNSIKDNIESTIVTLELDANIIYEINGDNLEKHLHNASVDLLIVDHNLPGLNGDELIKQVRDKGNLTEIVFYSKDIDNCIPFEDWQSVYITDREEADEKIIEVVNHFSKKISDINLMRGMIITEAIDLENQLSEIILNIFDDKAELFRNRILEKRKLDFQAKCDFLCGYLNDSLKTLRNHDHPDNEHINKIENINVILKELMKDVGHPRNILAHSERSFNDEGQLELKGLSGALKRITFNNDWKNDIRENIQKHRKNLYEVGGLLLD